MNNKWSLSLSIIAMFVSIIAISLIVCRIEPIDWNWLGIFAGILSLLVALMLGFQIWKIIDFDKQVKIRVKKLISDALLPIKQKAEEQNNEVWCGYYFLRAQSSNIEKDTLFWLFLALEYGLKIKSEHELEDSQNNKIVSIIEKMNTTIREMKESNLVLQNEAKERYRLIIADVIKQKSNIDVSLIFEYINS